MTCRSTRTVALTAAVLVLAGGGCASADQTPPQAEGIASVVGATSLPSEVGHVHSLGSDPRDGVLLLAGHSGLFRATGAGFERVGPAADLMGFTVVGPGHYLASGHPQPGTDLPQPMGLIESRDAGATWTVVSRGGASDFHVLTATGTGVIAHDGVMRRSADLREWVDVAPGFEPLSLAGRVGDQRVIASSATAVMSSTDSGRSWMTVPDAPSPVLLARAEDAIVAIGGDGRIHLSDASGAKWKATELRAPGPMALLASGRAADLEIVVLTERGLVVSRSGQPFGAWTAAP